MIFVTLGTQKFQFNRLLQTVDDLLEKKAIDDEVFAQTGFSDYTPKLYACKPFMDRDEFAAMQAKADVILTHGGTGAIVGALKQGKKVIAVPRLARYGEHVDDHQLQLIEQFSQQRLILGLQDCDGIEAALQAVRNEKFEPYVSNTQQIIRSIQAFIDTQMCVAPGGGASPAKPE